MCLFMVLKDGGVENENNHVVMNKQLFFCFLFFFPPKEQTETDAGGKFTWALKQSPWRPGFKCVCACASCGKHMCVCRLMCDVSQKLTRCLLQKCLSV